MFLISKATSLAASSCVKKLIATLAPALPSANAVALPIPLLPPVTRAIRPLKSIIVKTLQSFYDINDVLKLGA